MTFAERRQADRRTRALQAAIHHFTAIERRQAQRRADLSAMQGDWTGRYDRARACS